MFFIKKKILVVVISTNFNRGILRVRFDGVMIRKRTVFGREIGELAS